MYEGKEIVLINLYLILIFKYFFFICRKMKKEFEIYSNWWRIMWDDLMWIVYVNSEVFSLGCFLVKVEYIL